MFSLNALLHKAEYNSLVYLHIYYYFVVLAVCFYFSFHTLAYDRYEGY